MYEIQIQLAACMQAFALRPSIKLALEARRLRGML